MVIGLQSRSRGGIVQALRPRQWLKNALVVAAPLAGGEVFAVATAARVALLFTLLCAVSAAGYLVNDVRDIDYDRAHPEKRYRAIASGRVPVANALAIATGLAAVALVVGMDRFGWKVAVLLLAYIAATGSYSLWLKSVPGVEMVVVSAGFLLRAIIGGVGTGTVLSGWFLVVICASALLVVAGKRLSELSRLAESEPLAPARSALGSYSRRYLMFVTVMSAAVAVCGYSAWVLLVGAYRNEPVLIIVSVLPLAAAYARYVHIIGGGHAETPEDALLRDRVMVVCGLLWACMFASAVVLSA